jgi:hypothetical protein
MNKDDVLEILINYNAWRRGDIDDINYTAHEIGAAIDKAIKFIAKK